jgi:hypothetical protein
MTNDDEATPLPQTTVPATTQLSLMGFPAEMSEVTERFSVAMPQAMLDCGRVMDLERLAGVTVGFDFDAALATVDLGYASERAKAYTKNDDIVCVAKALRGHGACDIQRLQGRTATRSPHAGNSLAADHESDRA